MGMQKDFMSSAQGFGYYSALIELLQEENLRLERSKVETDSRINHNNAKIQDALGRKMEAQERLLQTSAAVKMLSQENE